MKRFLVGRLRSTGSSMKREAAADVRRVIYSKGTHFSNGHPASKYIRAKMTLVAGLRRPWRCIFSRRGAGFSPGAFKEIRCHQSGPTGRRAPGDECGDQTLFLNPNHWRFRALGAFTAFQLNCDAIFGLYINYNGGHGPNVETLMVAVAALSPASYPLQRHTHSLAYPASSSIRHLTTVWTYLSRTVGSVAVRWGSPHQPKNSEDNRKR